MTCEQDSPSSFVDSLVQWVEKSESVRELFLAVKHLSKGCQGRLVRLAHRREMQSLCVSKQVSLRTRKLDYCQPRAMTYLSTLSRCYLRKHVKLLQVALIQRTEHLRMSPLSSVEYMLEVLEES